MQTKHANLETTMHGLGDAVPNTTAAASHAATPAAAILQ